MTRALESRAGVAAHRTTLVTTYFDTADRALARQGLALRVRECGERFVQTVKSGPASGTGGLVRGEWEDAIAGPAPDPEAPQTRRFLPSDIDRLVPLFRTEVARRTIALSPAPGTCIEAAVDRGRVVVPGGGAGEPISEVELELKCGSPAVLYDVALDLLAVAPLRAWGRSKAERGYCLAAEAPPPVAAVHAAAIALDPGMSGSAALRRIGLACLEQIVRNEAAVLAGLGGGIHQMRVAARRLRSVLSGFGAMLPEEQRRWAADELRWLAASLGAARNLDMFELTLLAPLLGAPPEPAGLAALLAAAERRRKSAYRAAVAAIRSTRYTRLLLQLSRWFEGGGWRGHPAAAALEEPIAALAPRILDRRRRVVERRAKGFARQSPQQRHRLRVAVKKLRYAADVFASLYEAGAADEFAERLKRVQNDLGDANDARVGREIVAELMHGNRDAGAIAEAGAAVLARRERRLARREPKTRKHLDRLLATDRFWSR